MNKYKLSVILAAFLASSQTQIHATTQLNTNSEQVAQHKKMLLYENVYAGATSFITVSVALSQKISTTKSLLLGVCTSILLAPVCMKYIHNNPSVAGNALTNAKNYFTDIAVSITKKSN